MTAIVLRIPSFRSSLALLVFLAVSVAFGAAARAADAAAPTLAMLGFELLEDHPDATRHDAQQARLKMIEDEFRVQIGQRGLYTLVDNAPHQALIDHVRGRVEFLYRCPHCVDEIGAGMGTRYVAAGWVQKVSNLILNVNIEIREVATNRVALVKSVDMRGNNDESWIRAIRFLVRDMDEKRQANPRYGL
ncbi:MAG: hypothetical protein PWP40_1068 [Rhodocyclaceae bacterium]|nr:hypothetical protein [Rhodocyclaceae bacterium]